MKKNKCKIDCFIIICWLVFLIIGLSIWIGCFYYNRPTFLAGEIISTGTFDGNTECLLVTQDYFGSKVFAKPVGFRGHIEFIKDDEEAHEVNCYDDPYVIKENIKQ